MAHGSGTRSRREFVRIGRQLDPRNVAAQLEYALVLAQRDASILADCGWLPEDTDRLRELGLEIARLAEEYERRLGRRKSSGASRELLWRAKRWRMRALAIARNGLEGWDRDRVELLSRPTYSNPALLAEVVSGLLGELERHRETLEPRGADQAFLAEGLSLLEALRAVARGDTTAESYVGMSDEDRELAVALDEACGRAWDMLKKLNHAGRAANLLAGRRRRAAEYNLDLLSGRKDEESDDEGRSTG